MKLQTQIPLTKAERQINYDSQLFLMGSCFVRHMSDQLERYQFRSDSNPFGIVFHPLGIQKILERAIDHQKYTSKESFFHNERWHCYDMHSDLSNSSQTKFLENINTALESTRKQLSEATHLIITLGTAWVYRHNKSNSIVANCHKQPQKYFSKELLTLTEISESIIKIAETTRSINPELQCIFTVSPVRHIKDGFVENQRSKAHLITGLHQALKALNFEVEKKTFYFPAYEIMMDELRDYRFYAADMIHPNEVSIAYIWQKFKEVWVSQAVFTTMKEVITIQKGLKHRPFNAKSEKHKEFIKSLKERIKKLKEEYPFMRFND